VGTWKQSRGAQFKKICCVFARKKNFDDENDGENGNTATSNSNENAIAID
jgi:hypothetical protein